MQFWLEVTDMLIPFNFLIGLKLVRFFFLKYNPLYPTIILISILLKFKIILIKFENHPKC